MWLVVSRVYPILSAEVIDHTAPRPPVVAKGPTVDYGRYLASKSCMGCHGEGLSGGPVPGVPPDPPQPRNQTPDKETGLGNWSQEDFIRALREGQRPDGTALNPSKDALARVPIPGRRRTHRLVAVPAIRPGQTLRESLIKENRQYVP